MNLPRLSLRTLLLIPVFLSVFLVLASPRIITGHFCHITFDVAGVAEDGSLIYEYTACSSTGTHIFNYEGGGSGNSGSGGTKHSDAPFIWYTRSYSGSSSLSDLTGFVPNASRRKEGFKVEVGQTYKLNPGERLVIYEFHNPDTGETRQACVGFETLD